MVGRQPPRPPSGRTTSGGGPSGSGGDADFGRGRCCSFADGGRVVFGDEDGGGDARAGDGARFGEEGDGVLFGDKGCGCSGDDCIHTGSSCGGGEGERGGRDEEGDSAERNSPVMRVSSTTNAIIQPRRRLWKRDAFHHLLRSKSSAFLLSSSVMA